MTRVVYKYPISLHKGEVKLPKDAKIVAFGKTKEGFHVYAEVDPETKEKEGRVFEVLGTGMNFKKGPTHLKTHMTADDHMWHLYEHIKPKLAVA